MALSNSTTPMVSDSNSTSISSTTAIRPDASFWLYTSWILSDGFQAMVVILNMVLFGLTALRLCALHKSKYNFFSARGWSDIFNWASFLAALGYLVAYYVCYGLDAERLKYAGQLVDLKKENATRNELRTVGIKIFSVYGRIGSGHVFLRMFLLVMLWSSKLALVTSLFEFDKILTRAKRMVVFIFGGVTILSLFLFTMIYAIWTGNRDVVEKGKYRYSIYAETEYVVIVFSIITNTLVFLCSFIILSHLRLNKSEWSQTTILIVVFFISFALSISRLVSKMLDLTISLYVLTTAEAYVIAWAATIPAFRVWIKRFQDDSATGGVKRAAENAKGITSRKLSRGDVMLMESINGMGIDRRVSELDGLTRNKSQQSTHTDHSKSQAGTKRTMVDSKIDEIFIIPFKA